MFAPKPIGRHTQAPSTRRKDDRIIIHFVTCNYEARKNGLYKLQLITEAKEACPNVIIVLGEDLNRFRNHSKDLYGFLSRQIWSGKAERLGFDEVWLDVTDMVDYNMSLLNHNSLEHSWFCLDKEDPIRGFGFDASMAKGHTLPSMQNRPLRGSDGEALALRLVLGSHLASHLGGMLHQQKGFTSTVGISTNKELSKLAGNTHKPMAQTTLMPPYSLDSSGQSSVTNFLDGHEIGLVPGIGHKSAAQIRKLVRGREVGYKQGLVTNFTKEPVTIQEVRNFPGMGPELLEATLGGPGTPRGFGGKAWDLLHGVDDSEVGKARDIPKQISIEDTYLRLQDLKSVRRQLILLAASLIRRMRIDLTAGELDDDDGEDGQDPSPTEGEDGVQAPQANGVEESRAVRRWLAHPRTIRLSTRERKAQRSFARVSRSMPMPNFVFSLQDSVETLATKLADECLTSMFSKLIPTKASFDVSLINVAATNLQGIGGDDNGAEGRDIGKMFRTQEKVLSEWRVVDSSNTTSPPEILASYKAEEERKNISFPPYDPSLNEPEMPPRSPPRCHQQGSENLTVLSMVERSTGSEDLFVPASQGSSNGTSKTVAATWVDSDGEEETDPSVHNSQACHQCGALMPPFAIEAHLRFHLAPD